MKYARGDESKYAKTMEELPYVKFRIVRNGEDAEGPWARQGDGYLILSNHALHFLPYRSVGAIFPSACDSKDLSGPRETIDVETYIQKEELTLHPEVYDYYLKKGLIDANGFAVLEDEDEL